jgi:hypothetical protein
MQPIELTAPPILDLARDRRAPWVLGGALALGAFTQALFWNAGLGANWLAWDVVMVSVTIALLRRPRMKPIAIATAAVCLLFGCALVLHRSVFTTMVALPCNVAALAVLPIVVGEDLGFEELASLPTRVLAALGRTPTSIARTVLLPSDAVSVLDGRGRGVAKGAIAGLVIGVPAAGFFALLLAADPGFASALGTVHARLGAAATFAAHAAITAVIYAFVHAVYVRTLRANDDERTVEVAAPYRAIDLQGESSSWLTSIASFVSPLTWGLVIGQVAAVFGVFVVVHADTEFGGHAVVRERSWLTYSSHLHAGFYQLMLATVLSVCLVLAGHGILRARVTGAMARAEGATSAVPGGPILSALESALLVLTGLTLVSCAQRLKLYEEAYGATHLRLGVAFVGIAVFGLLLCTLGKAIVRSFRGFVGSALGTLTACALAASAFDADAYVARTNLDRVAHGAVLDEGYLSTLSADACTEANHPALSDPQLRARLLRAWSAHQTTGDPRAFRGLTGCPASGFGAPAP